MKFTNIQLILIFYIMPLSGAFAWQWVDLWQTPDQQAQKMMAKNQYQKATRVFQHPGWRAAAYYRAGDYEKAASLYSEMHTEDGYYNQGNALAHMGKYERAVEAYQHTLRINPDHDDAKHNLELIKSLLKQDKKQQRQNDNGNKASNKQNTKNHAQKQKQQNQHDASSKANDELKNNKGLNEDQQATQSKEPSQSQDKSDLNHNRRLPQSGKQEKDQQLNSQQQSVDLGQQNQSQQEQQHAQQQWLRLVPDDPGGLLREKFLRDHLRRQYGW